MKKSLYKIGMQPCLGKDQSIDTKRWE